ncbi:MAG: SLC13 family permease [Halocynthiibacter sp.]
MEPLTLTVEMMAVLAVLAFTIFLFVSEIVRVDLAAVIIMVLLGVMSYMPGLEGVAEPKHLFDGFASNAVISIIAVMIIGAGLDKTGIMAKVASLILKYGGTTEKRIVPVISGSVGVISSFMQNVGAAALFLPVVSNISARTNLPLSRLLMPMGFCAILGGTMTLVGSSPLILLNDLIASANLSLPAEQQMEPFSLFSVTPIGLALIATGVLYFMVFGRWVLPHHDMRDTGTKGRSMRQYLKRTYGIKAELVEVIVPEGAPIAGCHIGDLMEEEHVYIVGTHHQGKKWLSPGPSTKIQTPCRLALFGRNKSIQKFATHYGLEIRPEPEVFTEDFSSVQGGVAELVIPPESRLVGKTAREIELRVKYGLSLLAIRRGERRMSYIQSRRHEASAIGREPLHVGDTIVVNCQWASLARLKSDSDFVVVTTDFPQEETRPKKVGWAVFFLLISMGLVLGSDWQLSLCLLIGAVGMILTQVLTMDEAYHAVGWNTVFLLASLIPLGQAVQDTGTAAWIAHHVISLLEGWPIWMLQLGVAVLATLFTLVMSNVGATVLLVPLAVSIAVAAGADPAIFAMTVAISTSNSFLIPTHQVNALIMVPGRYKVMDFMRAGGIMTILFLVVSMMMMNWVL